MEKISLEDFKGRSMDEDMLVAVQKASKMKNQMIELNKEECAINESMFNDEELKKFYDKKNIVAQKFISNCVTDKMFLEAFNYTNARNPLPLNEV